MALLDIGREGTLLNGNPALVIDGLEAVPNDLKRNRIQCWHWGAHASTSICRLPHSWTKRRLPGGTSVVASNCVTTNGPSSVVPGTRALRSRTVVSAGRSALNQTGRVLPEFAAGEPWVGAKLGVVARTRALRALSRTLTISTVAAG